MTGSGGRRSCCGHADLTKAEEAPQSCAGYEIGSLGMLQGTSDRGCRGADCALGVTVQLLGVQLWLPRFGLIILPGYPPPGVFGRHFLIFQHFTEH